MDNNSKNKHLREAVYRIRERGMTVSGWARVHGFKPDTVFKILHGHYGSLGSKVPKRVIDALRKEDLLEREKG